MTTPLLDAVARLQSALDALARALTTGESDAVLAAEEPVASAVTALASFRRRDIVDVIGLPQAIAGVRAAVLRCSALGQSAEEFARAVFPEAAYGRTGLHLVNAAQPRRVTSIT